MPRRYQRLPELVVLPELVPAPLDELEDVEELMPPDDEDADVSVPPVDEVLEVDVPTPPVDEVLEVDVPTPPVDELLDVEVFTGGLPVRPPPSGVPVPSPEPPPDDEDELAFPGPDGLPPPAVRFGSASVMGGRSSSPLP